jgi:Flp pilus assembly protein TadG
MLRLEKHFAKGRQIKNRGGQALVMFALAITTICGLLALAVDVGLAYSIRKSAQSAADLAALAGAQQALSTIGTTTYSKGVCPAAAGCQSAPSTCPGSFPQTSIGTACLYASKNGFVNGSSNNGYTQAVSVAAFTNPLTNPKTSPIYAPLLFSTNYWVYVEISEQIPHLFGGAISPSFLNVDVISVAAIVQSGSGANKKSTISLVQ